MNYLNSIDPCNVDALSLQEDGELALDRDYHKSIDTFLVDMFGDYEATDIEQILNHMCNEVELEEEATFPIDPYMQCPEINRIKGVYEQ